VPSSASGDSRAGVVATAERGAAEAAQQIADALEAAGLSYAIGGALALAIAGVPRGTADVDVNVFVPEARVSEVIEALRPLGIDIDPGAALSRARRDGMFVGRWDGMRIDVFLPSIPFSDEAERTRIRVTDADNWSGWFLAAEALAVFKLLFFRGKDVVDLERLIAVRPELDRDYVRRWIVEMMGEDDERTRRWDDIVARHGPG
jgi:hypothetical protein